MAAGQPARKGKGEKMGTIGEEIINRLIEHEGKHIRIAFCPYKYSMWDSMESVWIAARAAGLDVSIIPLDYQTFPDGEWHNEREHFPQPTGQIDDIIRRDYDIIVIHYPYDGNNNVTKLRSNSWTCTLKLYGKVMYIPYHGNIAGDEWSRFFTQPGARLSDYIVLGSDMDVQAFYRENIGYQGHVIQVDNSPKADAPKIHADDPLPEEWEALPRPITVIIGTLWTFTHNPLDRMQKHGQLIERELAAGHGVIYRPHPLVYYAIEVMRPEMAAAYNDFIDEIRALGAIVDDGPNLHRTLAAADKIFTDPSSVIKTIHGSRDYEVIE